MNRKPMQISAYEYRDGDLSSTVVNVICNDGTLWQYSDEDGQWKQLPDIPQPEASQPNHVGVTVSPDKGLLKMSFGKYKGREICALPSDYLKWLAENCEKDDIRQAAEEEYQWREQHGEHFYEG